MIKNNSYNLLVFYFLSVTMQEGYIYIFFFLILKATLWKVGIIIIPILLYSIFIARKQDTL